MEDQEVVAEGVGEGVEINAAPEREKSGKNKDDGSDLQSFAYFIDGGAFVAVPKPVQQQAATNKHPEQRGRNRERPMHLAIQNDHLNAECTDRRENGDGHIFKQAVIARS